MGKQPASQFYWADYKKDVELHMMSFEARGVWMEMLASMWEARERGKIEGTYKQVARMIGCSEEVLKKTLDELNVTKTADVTLGNDFVTIINRRMIREEKERVSTRYRVQKHRDKEMKQVCNGNVTPSSSSSSSTSLKEKEIKKEKKERILTDADPSVLEIFSYWQKAMNHPDAKFSSERKRKIKARLKDGYTIEQCKQAIDNCHGSSYHMGGNEEGIVHDDIELIFRNSTKFERFLNLKKDDGHGKDRKDLEPHERRFWEEIKHLKKSQGGPTKEDPGASGDL
jgi:uncharacterized phage protein (TIGR02220 family)